MNGHYTMRSSLGMLVPAIVLGVPLLDLAFVFVVRLEKGLSPFRGSPDHLALRLRRLGLSVEQTVGLACGLGVLLGLTAFAVMGAAMPMAALFVAVLAALL